MGSILKDLIGDWTLGRTKRIPYAIYSICLFLLIFLSMTPYQYATRPDFNPSLGLITLGSIGLILTIFFVMIWLNITAKRVRDIGPHAWTTTLLLISLLFVMSLIFENVSMLLAISIAFALSVLPTDIFNQKVD